MRGKHDVQSESAVLLLECAVLQRAFCDDDGAFHAVVVPESGILSHLREVLQRKALPLPLRRIGIHRVGTVIEDRKQFVHGAKVYHNTY